MSFFSFFIIVIKMDNEIKVVKIVQKISNKSEELISPILVPYIQLLVDTYKNKPENIVAHNKYEEI